MNEPAPNGSLRTARAPLASMALIAGCTACCLALLSAVLRTIFSQLAHDPLVVRALALTYLACGFMLARVAAYCSAGTRRAVALLVVGLFLTVGVALAVRPAFAADFYDSARGLWAPWILGAPGLAALLLSRWRVT